MLRIICQRWTDPYTAEYVNILYDGVRRNLPDGLAGEFVCFTDDATGIDPSIVIRPLPYHLGDDFQNDEMHQANKWACALLNKLPMFKRGMFPDGDQIIYMDLDTVITGPLDAIAAYDGDFAILRDFYRPNGLQASFMAWRAGGPASEIYDSWARAGEPLVGNDQEWIEGVNIKPDILQAIFPGDFCSYKVHASMSIPKGNKVCIFHGHPRPHEVEAGWVPMVWKVGGGTSAEMIVEANVPVAEIFANIKSAMARDVPRLECVGPHDGVAMICAGGPSIENDLGYISFLAASGGKLFSVNGAYAYLEKHGLKSDYHVILDARPQNASFVPEDTDAVQLYSSQCHPWVLSKAKDLVLWHPYFDGVLDIAGHEPGAFIGGGTTAGLKAAVIAHTLGYRKIHLFGFDSCYRDGENHAYSQHMNDGERLIDAIYEGQIFRCAPWMVTQAEDFINLAPELISMGSELIVHGKGFIPYIAEVMANTTTPVAPELRAHVA